MQFRALPTYRKDDYALRADVVRQALEEDTENGLIPFMLSESRLRLSLRPAKMLIVQCRFV
jgi:hypothetical protein